VFESNLGNVFGNVFRAKSRNMGVVSRPERNLVLIAKLMDARVNSTHNSKECKVKLSTN